MCISDNRIGHSLLAFKLSRLEAPLSPSHLIELGHHVLKAHIYKSTGLSRSKVSSRDLQAYWLCLCTESLSAALVSHRNLYSPNVKVGHALLFYFVYLFYLLNNHMSKLRSEMLITIKMNMRVGGLQVWSKPQLIVIHSVL